MKIKILEVYFNTPCETKIVRVKDKKTELHQKIEEYIKSKVLTNPLGNVTLLLVNKITVKIKISELILFIEFNNNVYSIGLTLPEQQKTDIYKIKKDKSRKHADNKETQPRKRHKSIA